MKHPPDWQAMDLGSIERRLTEARDLLAQAAALLAAQDMEAVASLTDLHLDQESARHDQPTRRYR